MRNHIGLSDLITERDEAALKHLTDVRIEHVNINDEDADAKQENADATQEDANSKKGKLGYKLIFEFSPNDFFENEILEKTYVYGQDVDYFGEFVYGNAIGTTIQWKEDKDLTKEIEIKKQRNKSASFQVPPHSIANIFYFSSDTNRTRLVRKAKPVDSFFNFFTPPTAAGDDLENEDDLDLDDRIEVDCSIGEDLKEKVFFLSSTSSS